jgi:hypothetical protein
MTSNDLNLIDSILTVKASGVEDVSKDLNLPEGKSIAELLHDQQKTDKIDQISQK